MGRRLPGVDVPGVDAMEVDPLEDSVQKSLTTRRSGGVEVHRGGDRAADRRLLDGEDTHRGPRVEGGRRLGVDGQVNDGGGGQYGAEAVPALRALGAAAGDASRGARGGGQGM